MLEYCGNPGVETAPLNCPIIRPPHSCGRGGILDSGGSNGVQMVVLGGNGATMVNEKNKNTEYVAQVNVISVVTIL